jgi:hypothetical protein
MPRRFDRMEDAKHEIALIISTADEAGYATGYEPQHGYWWAHNAAGDRFRYLIELAE